MHCKPSRPVPKVSHDGKFSNVFSGELSLTLPPSISKHEYCSSCSVQAKLNNPSEPNWGWGSLTALLAKTGLSSRSSPVSCPLSGSLLLLLLFLLLHFCLSSLIFLYILYYNSPHPAFVYLSGVAIIISD